MDTDIFDLLEFLASKGVNKTTDISSELNGIYSKGKRLLEIEDIMNFTGALAHYIEIEEVDGPFPTRSSSGFFRFKVHITNSGINALKEERDRRRQGKLDKSVMATNEAVRNANIQMLENARNQEAIMQEQARFAGEQVQLGNTQLTLFRTQNNLYRIIAILTGVSILLSIVIIKMTYNDSNEKELLSHQNQIIEEKNKEIKQLQLLKSDTVHYVLHYPVSKGKKHK